MDYSAYNIQQQQQQQEAYNIQQQQQEEAYNYDPSSYLYQSYYPYTQQYAYYPDTTYQTHLQYQPEPAPVHPPGLNPTAPEPAPPTVPHVPTGPSQYRGRGGRAFRGGGRGRGRRLNGGRHFPSHAPAAPLPPPSRHVQCEICKVDCNTPEVLEQHKNGKRHKKNMRVHEDLQRRKATNGQQNLLIPSTQSNFTVQATQVREAEKKGWPTENMDSEVTADNHKAEKELQNNEGQTSYVPAEEPAGKTTDNSAVRGRGLKRKTKGGRGSKCMRTDDGSRRLVEPPKPQQAKSFICEVCNVKCESQVVYDSHLIGKKHLARLKRVHGRQSKVAGLQTLYPCTDINALASAINVQVQQGECDPQVLLAQLLMTLVSQAQQPALAPTLSSLAAAQIPAPTSVAGSSNELQLSMTQTSETTANVEMGNPTGEAKNLLLSVPLKLDDLPDSINALSNSITAQIQQGVTDPQVLLANLLTTILSQTQLPAIAPQSIIAQIPPPGPVAAQIPAPSSLAEPSNGPQLLQARVSEIAAHVEMGNPAVETKGQLLSVPLELDALAGSSSSTQIAGGSFETKLTGA